MSFKNLMMQILGKTTSLISSLILKVFGLLELFLFLRLLLKFLNANPKTLVVDSIYKYSDMFVSPFQFIFRNLYWGNHLIEIVTISAMLGYILAVFVIFQLLRLFPQD